MKLKLTFVFAMLTASLFGQNREYLLPDYTGPASGGNTYTAFVSVIGNTVTGSISFYDPYQNTLFERGSIFGTTDHLGFNLPDSAINGTFIDGLAVQTNNRVFDFEFERWGVADAIGAGATWWDLSSHDLDLLESFDVGTYGMYRDMLNYNADREQYPDNCGL